MAATEKRTFANSMVCFGGTLNLRAAKADDAKCSGMVRSLLGCACDILKAAGIAQACARRLPLLAMPLLPARQIQMGTNATSYYRPVLAAYENHSTRWHCQVAATHLTTRWNFSSSSANASYADGWMSTFGAIQSCAGEAMRGHNRLLLQLQHQRHARIRLRALPPGNSGLGSTACLHGDTAHAAVYQNWPGREGLIAMNATMHRTSIRSSSRGC